MSKEAIEMIRKMDMEQVENQFVLQCAPLIAGLKMSNLFIIRKNHLRRLCALLQNSGIRCPVLYLDGDTNGLIVQSCHARDLYAEQACHHNFDGKWL